MNAALPITAEDAGLGGWIIDQGLTSDDGGDLIAGLCDRLVAMGFPLWRFYIAIPTVSPDLRAATVRWQRGVGVQFEGVGHDVHPRQFEESPFQALLRDEVAMGRWRLGPNVAPTGFPVLDELQGQGATDYLAHLVSFDRTGTLAMRGAAFAFASDTPDGFTDDHLARLARLVPLLGLATCRMATSRLVKEVLGCYVGRDAGDRVLRGEIRRGEGHRLPAALLFADLRGFTGVAETSGEALVPRLGHHLAAMVEPVEEQGGEVLKFLGDGLLAAFALDAERDPRDACAAALAAAVRALALNAEVNARHPDEPPLGLDIALHRGEVFYGNIGAGRRLDFTVIGPAVNEASRIESMCDVLGRRLLMSEPFARCCSHPVQSLGHHKLRGVAAERELFGLA